MLLVENCSVVTRPKIVHFRWIAVDEGRIHSTGRMAREHPEPTGKLDAGGMLAVPGFIDIHTHGGFGLSLADGNPDSIRAYARQIVKHGVTGFLVTIAASPVAEMEAALAATREAMTDPEPGAARVLGANLEGPYLSAQAAGAQDLASLRPIDARECEDWLLAFPGVVKILTLAPELAGARSLIQVLAKRGVVPAIGHTAASYEETADAIKAGAWLATHTYNGMRRFHHRDPGPAGAVLASEEIHAECISDGVHVHPGAFLMLVAAKGYDRVVLVSDGSPATGLPDGEHIIGGQKLIVTNGTVRLESGTLAGTATFLDAHLRVAHAALGDDLAKLLRALGPNQARLVGCMDDLGAIEPRKHADITFLTEDLRVRMTMIAGEVVHRGPS